MSDSGRIWQSSGWSHNTSFTVGYIIVDNETHMNDSNDKIFNSTINMYQTKQWSTGSNTARGDERKWLYNNSQNKPSGK